MLLTVVTAMINTNVEIRQIISVNVDTNIETGTVVDISIVSNFAMLRILYPWIHLMIILQSLT